MLIILVTCNNSVASLFIFPSRNFTPMKSKSALDDFVITAWLTPSLEGEQYQDCHVGWYTFVILTHGTCNLAAEICRSRRISYVVYLTLHILDFIYIYIQGVTGGTDQTSGGCSLC
jgi:hypothetical protein